LESFFDVRNLIRKAAQNSMDLKSLQTFRNLIRKAALNSMDLKSLQTSSSLSLSGRKVVFTSGFIPNRFRLIGTSSGEPPDAERTTEINY
jgi:hypothetical protein